jgi:drug/metabolite transporter (DMT)-like permease
LGNNSHLIPRIVKLYGGIWPGVYRIDQDFILSIAYWALVILGVTLSSLGSIFLKSGATRIPHDQGIATAAIHAALEWRLLLGVLMYIVPVIIWIYLLKKLDITFLQPLFSLVYVITPVLAITYLGESVSIYKWIGIAIILLGIFISSKA